MTESEGRLRPPPSTRFAGPVEQLDLPRLARALRAESHPAKDGHRQTSLIHRQALRVLLFTFDAGGRLDRHHAPGQVVIQCLHGDLKVEANGTWHRLGQAQVLVLEPEVPHTVEATTESDMLLTVCLG